MRGETSGTIVVSVSRSFARFLPTGGSNRALGLSFGPDAVVQQQWQNNDDVAFTVQRPARDEGIYYWRAWTYDRIDLTSWGTTPTTTIERRANDPVLKDLADAVPFEGHHQVTFTITPDTFRDPWVLSPQTPQSVSEATHLDVVGTGGYFAALQRDQGGPYTVQALTPVRGDGVGELTQEALRAASTVYPDDIKNLYLAPSGPDQIGPDARALENKILAEAPSKAPFDLASQIEKELKSNTYTYSADLRDFDCVGLSTVECFARTKHGFCQYYAATMAVLLRDMGVPTRISVGFLPGAVDLLTGTEQVLNSSAHAWVEVYFPGYGWVTFDPTGGNVSQLTPLPSGQAAGQPTAGLIASRDLPDPGPRPDQRPRGPSRHRRLLRAAVARSVDRGGRPPPADRRRDRLHRVAARTAWRDERRRRVWHGRPHGIPAAVSGLDRLRRSTSTRAPSVTSCLVPDRSCSSSRTQRSSPRMAG